MHGRYGEMGVGVGNGYEREGTIYSIHQVGKHLRTEIEKKERT